MDRIETMRRQFERKLRIRQRTRGLLPPIRRPGKVRQPPSKGYVADPTPPRPKLKKITKFKKQEKVKQSKFPEEVINKYNLSDKILKDIDESLDVIDYRKDIIKHNKDLKDLAKKVCRDKINQGYIDKLFRKDNNNYQGTMIYYKDILLGFTNFYRKPVKEMFFINLICVNRKQYLKGLPLGRLLIDLVLYDVRKYEKKTKKRIRRIRLEAIPDAVDFYTQYGFFKTGRGFGLIEMDYIIH
jgi:hypothetical protein